MKLRMFSNLVGLSSAVFLLAGNASAEVELQPYFAYATGSHPEAVVIGDFNSDGRNDVLLNTSTYFDPENDYKLKVFLQDEHGGLQSPINYALDAEYTSQPKTIAAGDLNGDGLLDIAVGMDRSHIEVFLQYTDGTLFRADTIETPLSTRIAVADLNGDGRDDIAGIGWGGDDVGIFYQGEMGISHQAELHHAPHGGYDDMVLGDVNGDGANDIVVMSGQSYARDNLAVVASDGQGGFKPVVFYDLGGDELTKGVTIGDIDSDGLNDVAVTFGGNQPRASIAVFHQDEGGLLQSPRVLPSYDVPESILAADLNGSSADDLLVLHGGWYALGVYEQLDSGRLAEEALFSLPYVSHYNPQGLDAGDINGDDIADVVVADYNQGLVVLLGVEKAANEAPLADAGVDQAVTGNALVLLDGRGSTDSDGSIVNYRWSQLQGTPVSLNSPGDGTVSFVAPTSTSGADQLLEFQLKVEDSEGLTATDTVTVTVLGNLAPIADAGEDQTVDSGSSVTLDGSASRDSDGSIVGHRWRQLSGTPVEMESAPDGSATFIAPEFNGPVKEILEFELEVEDDGGLRARDLVHVIVEGPDTPIANAGEDQTVKTGELVVLDGSQSLDLNGSIVAYQWSQLSGTQVELVEGGESSVTFTAPPTYSGSKQIMEFELEVIDDDGLSARDSVYVVVEGNKLPIAEAGPDQTVGRRSAVELNANGSEDPDGKVTSYNWRQIEGDTVALSGADSAVVTFETPNLKGRDQLRLAFFLTVVDNLGATSHDRVTIDVVK